MCNVQYGSRLAASVGQREVRGMVGDWTRRGSGRKDNQPNPLAE
jgi:hypothetical protein